MYNCTIVQCIIQRLMYTCSVVHVLCIAGNSKTILFSCSTYFDLSAVAAAAALAPIWLHSHISIVRFAFLERLSICHSTEWIFIRDKNGVLPFLWYRKYFLFSLGTPRSMHQIEKKSRPASTYEHGTYVPTAHMCKRIFSHEIIRCMPGHEFTNWHVDYTIFTWPQ